MIKRLGAALLALMLLCPMCLSARAEEEKDTRRISALIREMVNAYCTRGKKADAKNAERLEEMYVLDPVTAAKWESILELWKSVGGKLDINADVLPDGLTDTDELCLVVLGYQLNANGSMKKELIQRLEVTLNCAEQYPRALILCTGGGTAAQNRSATEAGEMAEWLIQNGVDSDRIIVEKASRDTAQNAIFSCAILQEQYPQVHELAIISSDYHIATSILLFGAESTLLAEEAGREPFIIVSHAACLPPSGSLSTKFQGNMLLELANDIAARTSPSDEP